MKQTRLANHPAGAMRGIKDPVRTARDAALDVALAALNTIARVSRDEDARETADKALADAATLLKGEGR